MKIAPLATAMLVLLACGGATVLSLAIDEPTSSLAADSPLAKDALSHGLEVRRAVSTSQRFGDTDPASTVALVLRADRPYSAGDLEAYRIFMESGGIVLVADGLGYGTQVSLVAGITFERVRLLEPSGDFPAMLDGHQVMASSRNATALRILPATDADILGATSADSFVDRDGNGRIDASDPPGPFPFFATARVGTGQLWALSVPDVFQGDGTSHVGNAEFRTALLDEVGRGRTTLIVDETRTSTDSPLVTAIRTSLRAGATAWSQAVLAFAAVVGIAALAVSRVSIPWGPHSFDPRRFLSQNAGKATIPATGHGWTLRGLVAAGAVVALAIGSLITGSAAAAWAAALVAGAVAGAWTMGAPYGTAKRTLSTPRLQESSTAEVTVDVDLRGGLSGVDVRDGVDATVEIPSGSATVRPTKHRFPMAYHARPSRLGLINIGPLEAQRRDGFGLRLARRTIAAADELKVTPRLENARRTPFKSRVPQLLLGGHMVQRSGGGAEFLALRDYQPGDTMRMVNWKASARSKGLVVNQRVHESQTELTVFLDARAASDVGPAAATPFVLACRAGASIAAGAMKSRDRLRFVLYGQGIQEVIGRGMEQQRALEDRLAGAQAAGDTSLRQALEPFLPRLKQGRPVVVITGGDGDASVASALQLLRQRGARPFLVCPPVWQRPGPDGEGGVKARNDLIQELRGAGVPAYEAIEGLPLEDLFRIQGAGA